MRLRLALLALIAVIAALPTASAFADAPIDDYAYDKARDCRKKPTPGALALVDWLEKNAKGTFWGIMRCERWGKNSASLHAEGRAVDWHLDASRPGRPPRGAPPDRPLARHGQRRQRARARAADGHPGDHLELPLVVVGVGGDG